jgi:hypothetical protein
MPMTTLTDVLRGLAAVTCERIMKMAWLCNLKRLGAELYHLIIQV